MQEKHLKRIHLSRLSPVMWSWKHGYPRRELGVPIKPAYNAMGNYEDGPVPSQMPYAQVTGVNPEGTTLWNDLYRIGVAGKLSRVRPFGPSGFSGCQGCGNDEETGNGFSGLLTPWLLAILGFGVVTYLGTRGPYRPWVR
jgi:hypothetical protein